ncbi:hypothetical protein [Sphingomonas sp. Mn802worker]|uniref:hypothetical protein n=1 Tax=Sphingomonas sp. Mn802worker TaxID=629773 RepID=UPI0003A94F72|nr:hypothetical protein [Sphingomonas sp. Mn802worker]
MFALLGWGSFKDWLSETTGLRHHGWHVLLGLALTLGFTWALRRSLGSWLPLVLLALELVNEVSDFTRYYVSGWPWKPGPTMIDIVLTMAAPLAITIVVRMTSPHVPGAPPGTR